MAVAMSKDVIKRSLAVLAPFSELSEAELDTLARGARSVTVRKNARVFEEGAPADCCLVLTSGRAKVVLSGETARISSFA